MSPKPKNIIIIGGSLAGLFAGVALKRLYKNLSICILEKSPTPTLRGRSAAINADYELQLFFALYDETLTPLTVHSEQRLHLSREGTVVYRGDDDRPMTSWDLLYHLLRANFDGMKSDYYARAPRPNADDAGTTEYKFGLEVVSIGVPVSPNPPQFDHPVKLFVKPLGGEVFEMQADMVIAADGPNSLIRSIYFPNIKRSYAGYVAWRGTVPENQVSEAAASVFVGKLTEYDPENSDINCYTIPGKNGSTEPGERLLCWVWYVNYKEHSPEHIDVMTDKSGRRHEYDLPAGEVQEWIWERQKRLARELLPPQFAELVGKTQNPSVHAITDVIAPSAVLGGGKLVLVGDALVGSRPHLPIAPLMTAVSAGKLAASIESVINGESLQGLLDWG